MSDTRDKSSKPKVPGRFGAPRSSYTNQQRRPERGGTGQTQPRGQYGKPAQSSAEGQTLRGPYGKPATSPAEGQTPHTTYNKPAQSPARSQAPRGPYAKPAQSSAGSQAPRGPYAKPAQSPAGGQTPRGPYAKPAQSPAGGQAPRAPYARPAQSPVGGQAPRGPYARPAQSPVGGQAPRATYARPTKSPTGGQAPRAPYARPAQSPAESQPRGPYGKPAAPALNAQITAPVKQTVPFVRQNSSFPRPFSRPAPALPGRFNAPRAVPRPLVPIKPPPPKLSADARKVALAVLNRVLIDEGYASLSLDEQFQQTVLSPRDKRLAAAIVYKTLEDLLKLDFALSQYLKDSGALDPKVQNILRLSACQLLLMDKVPDFAAVNEAVDLVRSLGMEGLTGLVNGVLRSLIRGTEDFPWPEPDDPDYLRVTYSVPQWLIDRIFAGYDAETANKIIAWRNQNHAITLRRNAVLVTPEAFETLIAKKTWVREPGLLPGVWRVSGVSDIARDLDFTEGRFSIQGEGSMLAALAVAPGVGAQVLDCCAAPGGKTCYLAEMMQNTGRVHAWDLHEHRVDLIQAQADRLRLYNIRPAVRDATVFIERLEGTMDAVLLDAPCSGSGVMDSKPDIKYRLTPEGLSSLQELQKTLLDTCCQYVKPGGVLVYATCSIIPEENVMQIDRFLEEHPEFTMDRLPDAIPEEIKALEEEHGLQLLPHRDNAEGFFIARMRRVK